MTKEQYKRLKAYDDDINLFIKVGEFYERSGGMIDIYDEISGGAVKRNCAGCVSAAILSCKQLLEDYEGSM